MSITFAARGEPSTSSTPNNPRKSADSTNLYDRSMVIRTACSASLIALNEACRAVQFGDASAAVVAGSNLILGPSLSVLMTSEGVLSPDGSCKSFDAAANGYARAEGITAIYVKRLTDAIRDGNPIRAVIRGTGANSDGKSQGMLVPRREALELLMRKVYADSGLNPAETAFVEVRTPYFPFLS